MSTKRTRVGRPNNLERQIGPVPDYIRKLELDETIYNLINTDTAAYRQWKHDRQSGIDHGKNTPRLKGTETTKNKRLALEDYLKQKHTELLSAAERSASDVARIIIKREASRAKPDSRWMSEEKKTHPTFHSLRKIIKSIRSAR